MTMRSWFGLAVLVMLATSCGDLVTGPIALDDRATAAPGEQVTIPVTLNDRTPAGEAVSLEVVSEPRGTVEVEGVELLYTAPEEFAGEDAFRYRITTGDAAASAEVAVSVTPVPLPPQLEVSVEGDGTVRSRPDGIDCGTTCIAGFDAGDSVNLVAAPAPGWSFAGWGGDCSGVGACGVVMASDRSVTAFFVEEGKPQHVLTVEVEGRGRVSSAPPGIDCGSTCTYEFTEGTVVLEATAAPRWVFHAWDGGGCSGGAETTCDIVLSEDLEVRARFVRGQARLAVEVAGDGSVSSSPEGIGCPGDCTKGFPDGTVVTLTARPASGSTFGGWGGPCASRSTSVQCRVTVESGLGTVVAVFDPAEPPAAVSVELAGDGVGTVASTPGGIICPGDCTKGFPDGTTVTLTAQPASGSTFGGWGGPCSQYGTAPACEVNVTAGRGTVVATFDAIPVASVQLAVDLSGRGAGSVVSSDRRIVCPDTCTAEYETGTRLVVTAEPREPSTFQGWEGACRPFGLNPECELTLTAEIMAVVAIFQPPPVVHRLPVEVVGEGSGSVVSRPSGINCPGDCEEYYADGISVTLTADPDRGSTFAGWGGTCARAGLEPTCVVEMYTSWDPVFAAFQPERVAENEPPTALGGTFEVLCSAVRIPLVGLDPEEQPLTFAIASFPESGRLSGIERIGAFEALVEYTPLDAARTDDVFTFTVNDGELTSRPATITLRGSCLR